MENDTNFALGLRMGYFLAGLVSDYVESTCNDDIKPFQRGASDIFDEINNFIKLFTAYLQSYEKNNSL